MSYRPWQSVGLRCHKGTMPNIVLQSYYDPLLCAYCVLIRCYSYSPSAETCCADLLFHISSDSNHCFSKIAVINHCFSKIAVKNHSFSMTPSYFLICCCSYFPSAETCWFAISHQQWQQSVFFENCSKKSLFFEYTREKSLFFKDSSEKSPRKIAASRGMKSTIIIPKIKKRFLLIFA